MQACPPGLSVTLANAGGIEAMGVLRLGTNGSESIELEPSAKARN
jgi:hypothetical protein